MIVQPQARDTVAHATSGNGPSVGLIILLIIGVLVAAYFIWKAVQKKNEIPPSISPSGTGTHTTNPPKR